MDKPGTGIADPEEADKTEANGAERDGVEADGAEIDGADKPGTSTADPSEANRVDKLGTSIADLAEEDRADKSGTGTRDGADKSDTGPAAENPWRRPAERQVAARASLFSFHRVAYIFFSSSKLENFGFLVIFRLLSSVITSVK